MQRVELAGDPGHAAGKVDFVAEVGARLVRCAQRIHGRGHGGRARLLVVEDAERAAAEDDEEDGDAARPAHAVLAGVW